MNYSGSANPNATNSELDAKIIIKHMLVDLTKDELNSIIDCIDFVDDNWRTKYCCNDSGNSEETEEQLQTLRNKLFNISQACTCKEDSK